MCPDLRELGLRSICAPGCYALLTQFYIYEQFKDVCLNLDLHFVFVFKDITVCCTSIEYQYVTQMLLTFVQYRLLTYVTYSLSPKLSQLGRQLTERQLDNKFNSSFRFTNIHHVKSVLNQLTDDYALSFAELSLVRFEINCCHGNTNHL